MNIDELITAIPSAHKLLDWYGRCPSFHDAEVVRIVLDLRGTSELTIHAFATTNSLDSQGCYVTEKHALVNLKLQDVFHLKLDGFNHQNVIFSLEIEKAEQGFELVIVSSYGVEGSIFARQLEFDLKPGLPSDTVYGPSARGEADA
jgi:hypothetical protein